MVKVQAFLDSNEPFNNPEYHHRIDNRDVKMWCLLKSNEDADIFIETMNNKFQTTYADDLEDTDYIKFTKSTCNDDVKTVIDHCSRYLHIGPYTEPYLIRNDNNSNQVPRLPDCFIINSRDTPGILVVRAHIDEEIDSDFYDDPDCGATDEQDALLSYQFGSTRDDIIFRYAILNRFQDTYEQWIHGPAYIKFYTLPVFSLDDAINNCSLVLRVGEEDGPNAQNIDSGQTAAPVA